MKTKYVKSILTIVLSIMLCITFMPVDAFAEDSAADSAVNTTAEVATTDTATTDAASSDAATTDTTAGSTDNSGNSQPSDIESDVTTEVEPAVEPDKYTGRRLKTFSQNGFKLKFSNYVQVDKKLDYKSEPTNDKVKKNKSSRTISWKLASDTSTIDGYIILRKAGKSSTYTQIAKVGKNTKSYTDKKIKKKTSYSYTIVGYKKVDDDIRISACAGYGIIPGRKYQNPRRYIQITDKISKHGQNYYTSPVLVNKNSTKEDHIEAMIKTAYKYKGDKYVVCRSGRPGQGLDCSGLVMQACYGAGVDLWPINPARHKLKKYEYESRNIAKLSTLKTVSYKNRKRGDLIFFANSKGTIIHVAIYLGNNKIIHSTSVGGRVRVTGMGNGAYGRVCKVKRIFN